MKCRNSHIVFTRIRSPRAKSTSTPILSHFLTDFPIANDNAKRLLTKLLLLWDLIFSGGDLLFQRTGLIISHVTHMHENVMSV